MSVHRFTKSFVDRLPFVQPGDPAPQRIYHDSELKGLRLIVGRNTKVYAVSGRVRGSDKRKLIIVARHGDYEGTQPITIEEVRRRAADIKRRLRQGEDVPTTSQAAKEKQVERKRAKAAEAAQVHRRITLREGWEQVEREMRNAGASPRTLATYDIRIRVHLADWLDRSLHDIGSNKPEVVQRHIDLSESSGKASANGVMRVLRAVYNRIAYLYGEEKFPPNPVKRLRFNRVLPRKSALSQAQLRQWYPAILQLRNPVIRSYYEILLFTGLRKTSAAQIQWKHVDLEQRLLEIPNPKGGAERAFTLPISEPMRQIFEEREPDPAKRLPDDYVFPGRIAAQHTHLKDVRVPPDFPVPFTPHALRHTFNSIGVAVNVHPLHLKHLLNHVTPSHDIQGGYNNMAQWFDDLREAQTKITARILQAIGRDE